MDTLAEGSFQDKYPVTVAHCTLEEAKNIIDEAENVATTCPEGRNCLFYAVHRPDEDEACELARYILEARLVDPTEADAYGQTALFYAAREGHARCIEMFIEEFHFRANHEDQADQTPVFYSARDGKSAALEALVRLGANMDHVDANGDTAMFYAARDGREDTVKLMVELGADVTIRNKSKAYASTIARKMGHRRLASFLDAARRRKPGAKSTMQLRSHTQMAAAAQSEASGQLNMQGSITSRRTAGASGASGGEDGEDEDDDFPTPVAVAGRNSRAGRAAARKAAPPSSSNVATASSSPPGVVHSPSLPASSAPTSSARGGPPAPSRTPSRKRCATRESQSAPRTKRRRETTTAQTYSRSRHASRDQELDFEEADDDASVIPGPQTSQSPGQPLSQQGAASCGGESAEATDHLLDAEGAATQNVTLLATEVLQLNQEPTTNSVGSSRDNTISAQLEIPENQSDLEEVVVRDDGPISSPTTASAVSQEEDCLPPSVGAQAVQNGSNAAPGSDSGSEAGEGGTAIPPSATSSGGGASRPRHRGGAGAAAVSRRGTKKTPGCRKRASDCGLEPEENAMEPNNQGGFLVGSRRASVASKNLPSSHFPLGYPAAEVMCSQSREGNGPLDLIGSQMPVPLAETAQPSPSYQVTRSKYALQYLTPDRIWTYGCPLKIEEFEVTFPALALWPGDSGLPEIGLQHDPYRARWHGLAIEVVDYVLSNVEGAWLFANPVDPQEWGIDDYFKIVKEPMDFSTIRSRLLQGTRYHIIRNFLDDLNLVFYNCILYNSGKSQIGKICGKVQEAANRRLMECGLQELADAELRQMDASREVIRRSLLSTSTTAPSSHHGSFCGSITSIEDPFLGPNGGIQPASGFDCLLAPSLAEPIPAVPVLEALPMVVVPAVPNVPSRREDTPQGPEKNRQQGSENCSDSEKNANVPGLFFSGETGRLADGDGTANIFAASDTELVDEVEVLQQEVAHMAEEIQMDLEKAQTTKDVRELPYINREATNVESAQGKRGQELSGPGDENQRQELGSSALYDELVADVDSLLSVLIAPTSESHISPESSLKVADDLDHEVFEDDLNKADKNRGQKWSEERNNEQQPQTNDRSKAEVTSGRSLSNSDLFKQQSNRNCSTALFGFGDSSTVTEGTSADGKAEIPSSPNISAGKPKSLPIVTRSSASTAGRSDGGGIMEKVH